VPIGHVRGNAPAPQMFILRSLIDLPASRNSAGSRCVGCGTGYATLFARFTWVIRDSVIAEWVQVQVTCLHCAARATAVGAGHRLMVVCARLGVSRLIRLADGFGLYGRYPRAAGSGLLT
jgi:hypothetical protein